MANFIDNAKQKIRNFVQNVQQNGQQNGQQNIQETKEAPQPTEEDLMADAEINRRLKKNQTKSQELETLAYISDYIGRAKSSGEEYLYFCLNKAYRSDEDYVDLAQWILSHNGMQMEKHLSHIDGIEQFVLRMPIKEAVQYENVVNDILSRKRRIRDFQYGHAIAYGTNGKKTEVKFPRQEYERAAAKLKLKMDKEKAQIKNISPDMSR